MPVIRTSEICESDPPEAPAGPMPPDDDAVILAADMLAATFPPLTVAEIRLLVTAAII